MHKTKNGKAKGHGPRMKKHGGEWGMTTMEKTQGERLRLTENNTLSQTCVPGGRVRTWTAGETAGFQQKNKSY